MTDEALQASVLAYIATHLDRPGLGPGSVARAHHISTRTLYRLFEGAGHSIAETIRGLRLDRIRHELVDPAPRPPPHDGDRGALGFPGPGALHPGVPGALRHDPAAYRKCPAPGA